MNKYFCLIVISFFSLSIFAQKNEPVHQVNIITSMGTMKVQLYNETPLHRDNFLKLAREGRYDSLLFHRVINEFMIQTGDPESKNAEPNASLGKGGPGYTIPAEIVYPKCYHKKGALAAARKGDQMNPKRESSGSQFYIVQGKTFSDEELAEFEGGLNEMKKQAIFDSIIEEYKDSINALRAANDRTGLSALKEVVFDRVDAEAAKTPDAVMEPGIKADYKTLGGTPFLDNGYTVFGEVIEGLEVIDSIATKPCNGQDRPLEDILILKMEVLE